MKKSDWMVLYHALCSNSSLFSHSLHSYSLYSSLLTQTIWCHRFDVSTSLEELLCGRGKLLVPPLNIRRQNLYRILGEMGERGLVSRVSSTFGFNITLNLPGMVGMIMIMLERLPQSYYPDRKAEHLMRLLPVVEKWYKESAYVFRPLVLQYFPEELKMVRMEDAMSERMEKLKAKDKHRKEKKKSSKPLAVNDLRELFETECPNYGIRFQPFWDAKDAGQAKNWIKEYQAKGRDLRADIMKIIENWMMVVHFVYAVEGEPGDPDWITFSYVFRHRKRIETYINSEMPNCAGVPGLDYDSTQEEKDRRQSNILSMDRYR